LSSSVAHADTFTPAYMASRMAIQDLVYRWCRAIDRLDFEAMRSVFHDDALDNHNQYNGDIPGLVAWIKGRHEKITFSMHMVGNMVIEFASPTVALSESYLWVMQRYPADAKEALVGVTGGAKGMEGQGMDLMACSRYVDRHEKRNGEWRIAHRSVVTDWKGLQPFDSQAPLPRPEWNIGSHSTQDPLYRMRAEAGLA
jgi:hypothetical protein